MFMGVGHVGRQMLGAKVGGAIVNASPTLDLTFVDGRNTLDPRITFTRASTATYFDATGTMQTAATNAPRFDYDPVTHVLNGLLIEEARTNIALQSSVGAAPWASFGSAGNPVMTANSIAAPDGTISATRIDYGAVSGGGANAFVYQNVTVAVFTYVFSVWLKGAVGGEQIYLNINFGGASFTRTSRLTLTTQWQRFFCPPAALSVNAWTFAIGADLRDGSQTATPAQTIYAWGGQVEQGAFATSYIPTTAASVTRAIDRCGIAAANMGFYASPGGSWVVEFISPTLDIDQRRILSNPVAGQATQMYLDATNHVDAWDTVSAVGTSNTIVANAVQKCASTWAVGSARLCLAAGPIASVAAMTAGFPNIAIAGVNFFNNNGTTENLSGYLRRVTYWPRVLSDAEMQTVTT